MPINIIELGATYEMEDGREAIPKKEFSSPIDGNPIVEVEFRWVGNITSSELPTVKFMAAAVRKLTDPEPSL
jgi:hypothetical protein